MRCGAGAGRRARARDPRARALFPIVSGVALQEGTGEKGKGKGAGAAAAAAGLVGGGARAGAHMSNLALLRQSAAALALLDLASLPRPSGKKLIEMCRSRRTAWPTTRARSARAACPRRRASRCSPRARRPTATRRSGSGIGTRAPSSSRTSSRGSSGRSRSRSTRRATCCSTGFEEQIRLYHVCEDNLLLAFEIPVKGVVTLRDGESIARRQPAFDGRVRPRRPPSSPP